MEEFNLQEVLVNAWNSFIDYLPALSISILVIILTFFLARLVEKWVTRWVNARTHDTLTANFFGTISWAVLLILGILLALGIMGLGSISNKILAGAGISTLVIGFAFKDLGENFLAGVMMAFSRPFRVGNVIESQGIKGKVINMSLRETTIKTFDGKDVYIPNAVILKNPLFNFTIDGYFRKEFVIGLDYDDDVDKGLQIIEDTVNSFEDVLKEEGRQVSATISELATSTVNVSVRFWYNTQTLKAPANKLASNVMLNVYKQLASEGYYLPADIIEVKNYNESAIKSEVAEVAAKKKQA